MDISLVLESITYAMKAKKLLYKNGINSYINKCDDSCGCCYCISFDETDKISVTELINSEGINILKVI